MTDLRPPAATGPQASDGDRRQPAGPVRPKRTKERGPAGFGSVMRDVRRGRGGEGSRGGEAGPVDPAAAIIGGGVPGGALEPGAARHGLLAPSAERAAVMVATAGMLEAEAHGVQSAEDALEHADQDLALLARRAVDQTRPQAVQQLGQLAPRAVMERVLDEATRLEIDEAMKELHVELEPEHLGPLVVRLRRTESGVEVRFRAREAQAATVIDDQRESLVERLLAGGYETARVEVAHDRDLQLGLR